MPTTGRSAVLTEPRRFVIETGAAPEPGPGEVRVRVCEVGICGSDLKMYTGEHPVHRPPLLLGHELTGIVDAVGDGVVLGPGTAVAAYPAIGCGECHSCRRGEEQLCPRMRLIGGHDPGGLAEFVLMPEANAVPLRDGLPAELAVLTEPMAVAVHGVERGAVGTEDRCLVVGAGPIGIFAAMVLVAAKPARLVVVDRDPARLEVAAELGFEAAADSLEDPADLLGALGEEEGFEAVFDCAGGGDTADRCLRCVVPGGRLVLIGVPPLQITLDSVVLQRGERDLLGAMMYSRREFGTAMDLLAELEVPVRALRAGLLRETFPLDRVGEAFATLAEHRAPVLKLVIAPGAGES